MSPTGARAPQPKLSAPAKTGAVPDIIPFTRPRAISSLPVQFAPVEPPKRPSTHPHLKARNVAPEDPSGSHAPMTLPPSAFSASASPPARSPAKPTPAPIPFPVQPRAVPAPKSAPMPAAFPHGGPNAYAPASTTPYLAPLPQGPAPSWNQPAPAAPNPWAMGTPVHAKPALPAAPAPLPPMPQPHGPPTFKVDNAATTRHELEEAPTVFDAGVAIEARSATARVAVPSKWAAFEKLGLVAKKVDPKSLSKHVVTAYRLLGFSILTIIVIVLVGYITQTAFFYFSDSWVVPMAVSPTDEKVLSLQAQLSERQNSRDRIAADLAQAERAIAVQQDFQAEFAKAIKSDLAGRKVALAKMHELAAAAASTRANIRSTNSAYAAQSRRLMQQEWSAGLIDRNQMLSGKYQLAQVATSNLSLAERQAEYETRAADLDSQTRSLEALLADKATDEVMSYDVLKIKQEYEASRLETQKAIDTRDTLKAALEREQGIVDRLARSSYLRAIGDHAEVAFVPYGNLHRISKGTGLYGCSLGMFWCHKVGEVLDVLPGEVQFKHPHKDKMLRGQMVELRLDAGENATDDVLYVGKPLLL